MKPRTTPELQRAREAADRIGLSPTPVQRRVAVQMWCAAMLKAIAKERRPQLKLM